MNFGLWEGCYYDDVARLYPDEWKMGMEDWRDMHPTEGECFRDFYSRVSNALKTIIESYDGKKVALITHGGCMRVILQIYWDLKRKVLEFYFNTAIQFIGNSRRSRYYRKIKCL